MFFRKSSRSSSRDSAVGEGAEQEPLFGTGNVSLQDPPSIWSSQPSHQPYGGAPSSTTPSVDPILVNASAPPPHTSLLTSLAEQQMNATPPPTIAIPTTSSVPAGPRYDYGSTTADDRAWLRDTNTEETAPPPSVTAVPVSSSYGSTSAPLSNASASYATGPSNKSVPIASYVPSVAAAAASVIPSDNASYVSALSNHSPITTNKTLGPGGIYILPQKPYKNPALLLFRILNYITIGACAVLILCQLLPIMVVMSDEYQRSHPNSIFSLVDARVVKQKAKRTNYRPSTTTGEPEILATALRVYMLAFCILFILIESNAPVSILQRAAIFQSFLFRGFLYTFIALNSFGQAYSEDLRKTVSIQQPRSRNSPDAFVYHMKWVPNFMKVCSWLFLCVGLTYAVMGCFCLNRVKERMEMKDRENLRKYNEAMNDYRRMMGFPAEIV